MKKIFDSHSHYNDEAFKEDLPIIFSKLEESGIGNILNCGYDLSSSKKALQQANQYNFVYSSAGYHPQDADKFDEYAYQEIKKLLAEEKVVAVGEIGLDYYYDDAPDREVQKNTFKKQLQLARECNKPVIIHTRDAMADTIEILKPYAGKLDGVIHCYSGSAESCRELVKMGFYIGFTGVVTFKNARRALESLKEVPLDRILVETDCPYMAPEPNRGKRCDSTMLNFTVEKIAQELGIAKEDVISKTCENANRLFRIK